MPGRATVVAVANQKGGVAKTTTVACLGAGWAASGHRVLLVDLDPQACLTFSLGYDRVVDRIGADHGVPVLGPPIPRSVRFAEAPAAGRTLVGARRTTKGAQAYGAVAADLAAQLRPA